MQDARISVLASACVLMCVCVSVYVCVCVNVYMCVRERFVEVVMSKQASECEADASVVEGRDG